MGKCLQITFGIINFLLWLGGAGLFGLSVWLVVNPESFFDFAEDTNNLINGDNATLPEELTIFTDKIANGLYLSMAAGKLCSITNAAQSSILDGWDKGDSLNNYL